MAKPKRVLWLVTEIAPEYRAKQQILEKHNHHVTWVHSLDELTRETTRQRAHVIIVSEQGPAALVCDHILGLSSITEAKGSRWILTLKDHNPKVIKFATGSNFRDLIPLDLADKQWIFRFLYATAGKAVNVPLPAGQITLSHRTDIKFPFRLIWLTSKSLRMETHIIPPVGSTLNLSGSFLAELPAGRASLLVEKVEHSQLSYRFSTAIEGSWIMPQHAHERVIQLISQLQVISPKPRYRLFIAAKSPVIRKKLFAHLSSHNFEINSALQLKSLTQEPLFFSPDMVIIESTFCRPPYQEHCRKMQASLSPSVPLIMILEAGETPPPLEVGHLQRSVIYLSEITSDFLQIVKAHLPDEAVLTTRQHQGAAYFDHDDRLAFGDITTVGKLNKLHPLVAEVVFPYPIKDFALCQLLSPLLFKWLRKYPWIKLTQLKSYVETHEQPFLFSSPAFFLDLTLEEKKSLSTHLARFIAKVLGFTAGLWTEEQKKSPAAEALFPLQDAGPLAELLPMPEVETSGPLDPSEPSQQDHRLTAAKQQSTPLHTLSTSPYLKPFYETITSQGFRYFCIFLLVSFLLAAFFVEVVPHLLPYYKKSGKTYVDQLNKFSGGLRKGEQDEQGGEEGQQGE